MGLLSLSARLRSLFFAGYWIEEGDNDIRVVMTGGITTMASDAIEEMRAYEAYVAEMAALADGRVIKNSSLAHAEIVIAQIFKTSKSSVDILTGHLDARVYGSDRVCDAARAFLGRNKTRIRILSESDIDRSHPFILATGDLMRDRVAVRTLPESVSTPSHFALGDDKHLRIEADKTTCDALVMFGVKEQALGLSNAFDSIFTRAKELA